MSKPLRDITLESGLTVSFVDSTSHYYGGYYRVAVVAECTIVLCPDLCPPGMDYQNVRSMLGDTVRYSQQLERMGVRDTEIESVREQLIEQFIETGRGYLSSPDFPARLVSSELQKLQKRSKTPNQRFSLS